jgi:hypothetical protein
MWQHYARQMTRTLGSTAAHPARGETLILRRPGSIEDVGADATPRQMTVAAPALAEATTLTLRLPSSGKIKGTLPAGARLNLGVDTYTSTADVTAAAGTTTLTVTFAPALAGPAAAGAIVDLQPDAVFTLTDCHVSRRLRRDLARDLHADAMAVLTVPVAGQPITPRLNDQLELEDGTVGRVAGVPITTGAFWKLQMGG